METEHFSMRFGGVFVDPGWVLSPTTEIQWCQLRLFGVEIKVTDFGGESITEGTIMEWQRLR